MNRTDDLRMRPGALGCEMLDEGESEALWGWETGQLGDVHYSHWPAS